MKIPKRLGAIVLAGSIFFGSLFPANALALDKKQHLAAGAGIGAGAYYIGPELEKAIYGESKIHPIVWGIGMAGLAGVGKELVYDWAMGQGKPEWSDFGYTIVGAYSSVILTHVLKGMIRKATNKN